MSRNERDQTDESQVDLVGQRRPPEHLLAAATAALQADPNVGVVAVNGLGLCVPVPAAVRLPAGRELTGYASGVDFVVPEDLMLILDVWVAARRSGWAQVRARLARDPTCTVTISVYDTTPAYGVFLVLVGMPPSSEATDSGGPSSALTPRVTTVRKNELGVIVEVDDAFGAILGWSAKDVVGRRSLEFIDPEDHACAVASWIALMHAPQVPQRARLRHKSADGSWRWFEVTNRSRLSDVEHGDVLAEMVDITDEMSAHEQLRSRELLLRRLTQTLPVGVMQFDVHGRVVYRNERLAQILGAVDASTVDSQFRTLVEADRAAAAVMLADVLDDRGDRELEAVVRVDGEGDRRISVSLRALTADDGVIAGGIGCVSDVTESVELREQLAEKATFDGLTRLFNRPSILAVLHDQLEFATHGGVGVVFVDLDGFKQVNDEYGHEVGDAMLVAAADRLKAGVRKGDVVGRLGGDEFLVVCPHVDSQRAAQRIGRRLATLLTAQLDVGGHSVPLRASIGVAWAFARGTDMDRLVADADQAMYESKREGLGRPVVRNSHPWPPGRDRQNPSSPAETGGVTRCFAADSARG